MPSKMWEAVQADPGSGIFTLLTVYPLGTIAAFVIFVNLITFLVTSADSASFLIGMLMSKGDLEPKPGLKVIWGTVMGSLALILLLSGGLQALQTASIVAALPFSFVMIAMMYSLVKGLRKDSEALNNVSCNTSTPDVQEIKNI